VCRFAARCWQNDAQTGRRNSGARQQPPKYVMKLGVVQTAMRLLPIPARPQRVVVDETAPTVAIRHKP
jgi:hypothetical protein